MSRFLISSLAMVLFTASAAQCQQTQNETDSETDSGFSLGSLLQDKAETSGPRAADKAQPSAPPDPATPSPKIREALELIRRVEEYDQLAREMQRLKAENDGLQQTIANLQEQLSKKSTEVPEIIVRAKAIATGDALAMLEVGGATVRVRQGSELLVPAGRGENTPMRINHISPESIEVEFPELNRTVFLYD